jgi:hypothetical protein
LEKQDIHETYFGPQMQFDMPGHYDYTNEEGKRVNLNDLPVETDFNNA